MGSISNFEDIDSWKLARELCQELFVLKNESKLGDDYGLWNQVNRSSGSIMDNIAEGFGRGGNKELVQYLFIAKGSASELRSQIHRMSDRNYVSTKTTNSLLEKVNMIEGKIGGFIKYLKSSDNKGYKFSEPES